MPSRVVKKGTFRIIRVPWLYCSKMVFHVYAVEAALSCPDRLSLFLTTFTYSRKIVVARFLRAIVSGR